jgi:hypothetical protein
MKSKTPVLATEYRVPGSIENLVGRNGEVNASNKKDLLQQQLKLLSATSRGEVTLAAAQDSRTSAQRNRELVQAMFQSSEAHAEIGQVMATNLYQTANRRGFARKFLGRQELVQGQFPVAKLRRKDVSVVYSTSPTKVESQIIRDKTFTPPEIMLEARPFVEQREINTSSGDVLEEKYTEAMESIMVGEDRLWYQAANATIGVDNDLTIVSGTLTPLTLAEVRTQVARWNLSVTNMLMAADLWQDIIGDSDFIQAIEPVSRHELIMTGELAVLYGMALTSDAYRHPEHKVLNQGEFFAIAAPETHGQYTDRGGIETETLTAATEKVPGRGWLMYEAFSLVIANTRSVAKGIRR